MATIRHCAVCGKLLHGQAVFCSQACGATFAEAQRDAARKAERQAAAVAALLEQVDGVLDAQNVARQPCEDDEEAS